MTPEPPEGIAAGELMLLALGGVMTLAVLAIAVGLFVIIRREEREAARVRKEAGE